jgi:hypothetical protein
MPSIIIPTDTRVIINDFFRFIPQKRITIISKKNGRNTLPKYEILLELSAEFKLGDTEIIKYPRLHTDTDTNTSNKYMSLFLSNATHIPTMQSEIRVIIPYANAIFCTSCFITQSEIWSKVF